MDKAPPILIILGPTASGKTDLAINLAKKFNGSLINSDSLQVYYDLNIITARPEEDEFKSIDHYFFGELGIHENCTAWNWSEKTKAICKKIIDNKKLPIIAGGTGLYISALLNGLSTIPSIPVEIRQKYEDLLHEKGLNHLNSLLKQCDPSYHTMISENDRQRTIRALEVYDYTKKPYSLWRESKKTILEGFRPFIITLLPDRQLLYDRCDKRFIQMIKNGALSEVARLLKLEIPPSHTLLKAIGVREIKDFLDEKVTLEQAILKGQQLTRNYAKRQYTWFRNQINPRWKRIELLSPQDQSEISDLVIKIKNHLSI